MSTKIKELDLSKSGFTANGKNYIYTSSMSTDHFYKMKEFEMEVALDKDIKGLTDDLNKIYGFLNNRKDADAAVALYNTIKSLGSSMEREKPILKLCSCFIFEENEDPRFFNENNMSTKINDWLEEGISITSFFRLAANTGSGLKEILNKSSEDSSLKQKA